MRIFSHLFLQFHSNCLWICDNCSPNSLNPSFPTHSLQIYCLGLIGPVITNGTHIIGVVCGKEPVNSQWQDDFLNLECERDRIEYREGSVHTTHTSKIHSRGGSHISQRQDDNKAIQKEIDDLKKKLCHAQRKRSPSSSDDSSNDEDDVSYRRRSRTPLSESLSCDEEPHHRWKYNSLPHKGIGNDVMNKALS